MEMEEVVIDADEAREVQDRIEALDREPEDHEISLYSKLEAVRLDTQNFGRPQSVVLTGDESRSFDALLIGEEVIR